MRQLGAGRAASLAGAAALALALVALALRLYRIEFQSLWWDEGISLYLAGLDAASLTTAKDFGIDLHPPLYHLLLAGWLHLAGSSAFAARYLSAMAGALAVPVAYYLGRRAFGPGAGLLAALLLAASPFHVFYSQEARMYSLMPLLGLASTALALRILDRRRASTAEWAALALVDAAGLYLYYYLGFLLVAENLAFLAVLLGSSGHRDGARVRVTRLVGAGRRSLVVVPEQAPVEEGSLTGRGVAPDRPGAIARAGGSAEKRGARGSTRRFAAIWLGVQAATVVLYAPWLAALWGLFASGAATAVPRETAVYLGLRAYLGEGLQAFGIGFSRPAPWTALVVALALGLAALGVLGGTKSRAGWWLLGLGIAVPVAGAYLVMLGRPFFYPRFVGYVAPLLYVLIGAGLWRLSVAGRAALGARPIAPALRVVAPGLAAAALLGLLAGDAQSLVVHYTRSRAAYSSSDYRVVLGQLASAARPGDAVVGTYPWQLGYVAGYLPNAGLRPYRTPAQPSRDLEAEARRLVNRHGGVWLLLYFPNGTWTEQPFERALAEVAAPALVDQFGDSRLRLFQADPPDPGASPAARLGDRIALLRYSLEPAGDRRPGQDVDLTLVWQARAPVGESYTVFTHLVGPDGRVWGQVDSPPLAGSRPTTSWRVGEVIVDRYRLRVAPDAPVGEYLAEVGLYLPATGQRLTVGRSPEEADRVIVGRLRVVR